MEMTCLDKDRCAVRDSRPLVARPSGNHGDGDAGRGQSRGDTRQTTTCWFLFWIEKMQQSLLPVVVCVCVCVCVCSNDDIMAD